MKFSVGKIIWKTFSKILSIALWAFFILVSVIFFFIIRQAKLDFQESCIFLLILCSIYSVLLILSQLIIRLSGLVQFFCLIFYCIFYFNYGYQILSHIQTGTIDNNFFWSLPDSINNLIGFSIQGKVIDFLFWSGFVLLIMVAIGQLVWLVLLFLANRKIGFALEIIEGKKAKLMEKKRKYIEALAKVKPPSGRQKILIAIFCILLVGLIASSPFLFEKWKNRKYPILWEKSFPGTAIWLDDCPQCGKKGTVLTNNVRPGEPRMANFSLQEKDKEMILDVKLKAQVRIKPYFSLETELKNPDKKTILHISKEELFKGSLQNPEAPFQKRFYFTPDKKGEYTLKITPYSYGIFTIQVLVRDIVKK